MASQKRHFFWLVAIVVRLRLHPEQVGLDSKWDKQLDGAK